MLTPRGMGRFPQYLVVVRTGETQLFEDLKEQLAREPYPAALIWDRRRRDRRVVVRDVAADRRTDHRRAPPDATWETHGFVVTETDQPPPNAVSNRLATLAPQLGAAVFPRDPGAARRQIQRVWERGERIFALRMFALNLQLKMQERRAKRQAVATRDQADGRTVVLA